MQAIIRTGGKQYRVTEGDRLKVETLAGEPGEEIEFEDVLYVQDGETHKVGTPRVDGVKVTARVVGHGRGAKIKIVKFRRRKHHRKQMGHRQNFTEIEITGVAGA